MATKNISYLHKKINTVFFFSFSLFLLSCSGLITREEAAQRNNLPPNRGAIQIESAQPLTDAKVDEENVAVPNPEPTPIPKENLKVGIILGPGGIKAYAHIGVLEELSKAKIPIYAITGLEWGSLVASLYSLKGQVYDTQWQMQKLKKEDLPSGSLISRAISEENPTKLNSFLSSVFENKKMEEGDLPFSCPTIKIGSGDVAWKERGPYYENLLACIAFPPFFKAFNNHTAATFSLSEASDKLRDKGANLIIFINVIDQGDFVQPGQIDNEYSTLLIWQDGRKSLRRQRSYIDEVITVDTSSFSMVDYDSRNDLILKGNQAGKEAIRKLIDKYGF